MSLSIEERAIRQLRNTMLLMDWIEATGRDPEDENNWTDQKVETARQYWKRHLKRVQEKV